MSHQLLVLSVVCFLAMLSPGPDFFLVTKNSLSYKRPQALATAFGIVTGNFIAATYCVLGVAVIIAKSVIVFSIIKYAGAAYLVYLGVKGLFSKSTPSELQQSQVVKKEVSIKRAYVEGLMCNLLNPKLGVFLLSVFTQFISPTAPLVEKVQFAVIFTVEAFIYFPTLVFILQSPFIAKGLGSIQVMIDRICGVILIGLGIRVALSRG